MVKKPFIIFVAIITFGYGLEATRLAITYAYPPNFIFAAIAFVASVALIFNKRWSQYLVYVLALSISGFLIYVTWVVNKDQPWPYETLFESFIAVFPAVCYLILCFGCSVVVFKHFRGYEQQT